jgi:two-component system cell cycle sensor histidine kinase/response regulator CckA
MTRVAPPSVHPPGGHAPRVLLVDDDATQLKLCRLRLLDAGYAVQTAQNASDALALARAHRPNAIVSDVLMGDVDGFGLVRQVREDPSLGHIPVILLSAHYRGEEDRQLALRLGAAALVARTPEFETELAALRSSLADSAPEAPVGEESELHQQQLRSHVNQISQLLAQARDARELYRALFENARDAVALLGTDGTILEANERWPEIVGVPRESLIGRNITDFTAEGHEAANQSGYQETLSGEALTTRAAIKGRDGTVYMLFTNSVLTLAGKTVVFSIGHDITPREEARRSLELAEERYRSLLERIPDVILTLEDESRVVFVTPNVQSVCGCSVQEMYEAGPALWVSRCHPEDLPRVHEELSAENPDSRREMGAGCRWQRPDGSWICLRVRRIAGYEKNGHRYADYMVSDVTEKQRLEENLRQAQKMEAVGQLTGGIAHDFNNMLAAILGNTHFLLEALPESDPRRKDADEIRIAAERGAGLTRQLLAYSRRQVLAPTLARLDKVLLALEPMLRRLLSEDIELTVRVGKGPGTVRVDVSQIEQVVLNLVVNARDAMPRGGKLLIEVVNIDLASPLLGGPGAAELPAGQYVMLLVSDTGTGMDAETKARLFEPFFTTKGAGKGTGLGLATCDGIIKQSGGHILVYSELQRGTTFEVFLPRVDGHSSEQPRRAPSEQLDGSETVLLIEDDEHLRAAIKRMLEARGYQVLVAANGLEALACAMTTPIQLVVSDVVMPGRSGPEVVEVLRAHQPNLRAIFMSGHTDHAALHEGVLGDAVHFVQKPFSPLTLVKKVREVLDV